MSVEEVAAFYNVAPDTVRYWRLRGIGPRGVRLGRVVRYRRVDVERWFDEEAKEQEQERQRTVR